MRDYYQMEMNAPVRASGSEYFDAMVDLAKRWHLRNREARLLLAVPERTFYQWKAGRPHLTTDQCDRISHLANIEIALTNIFNDRSMTRSWIRRPNEAFEERTPLDVMIDGGLSGILRVRTYLQSLR